MEITKLQAMRVERFGSLAATQRATKINRDCWRSYELGQAKPHEKTRRRIERIFGKS